MATVLDVLYFQAGASIARVDVSHPATLHQIVRLPNPTTAVTGIVLQGSWMYWATLGPSGAIMRATIGGSHIRPLVDHLRFPRSLAADGHFLYWLDENAVGRVAFDGSRLNRKFIVPPRDAGGSVGEGLATDQRFLYVSSCFRGTIGRAAIDGSERNWKFINVGQHVCPQGLAIGAGYIYWTGLAATAGTIGRATLNGSEVDDHWFRTPGSNGPLGLVTGAGALYWSWGGAGHTTPYIGRITLNRSHITPRFVVGENAMTLAQCAAQTCRSNRA